jgi:hypothetical protein
MANATKPPGNGKTPRAPREDGRVKAAYWLPPDVVRELRLASVEKKTDGGQIIADALRDHLAKFSVIQGYRRVEAEAEPAAQGPPPAGANAGGAPVTDDQARSG